MFHLISNTDPPLGSELGRTTPEEEARLLATNTFDEKDSDGRFLPPRRRHSVLRKSSPQAKPAMDSPH